MPKSTQNLLEFAIKTAKKAGKIVMKNFEKPVVQEPKGIRDVVTKYDRASEEFIVGEIKKHFPDHEILGEEGGLRHITKQKNAKNSDKNFKHNSAIKHKDSYLWLVDPIDGTKNFARKLPMFAVSIGLYKNGEPLMGVVYNPYMKDLFYAEKGKGAYRENLVTKKHRIHVTKTKRIVDAVFATGFHPEDAYLNLPIFADITYKSFATRRTGSAAIDICFTACGIFDGFWEYHLKPWDIAAGNLILQEAGGKFTNFDGTKLDFKQEKYLCSNGVLHKTLIKEIKFALKKGFK